MRLLLDECVPARLRRALLSHEVSTVGIELPCLLRLLPALEQELGKLVKGSCVLISAGA